MNTPLRRAEDKARRGVPVEDWTDEEVHAFCGAHCGPLASVNDETLAALTTATGEAEIRRILASLPAETRAEVIRLLSVEDAV